MYMCVQVLGLELSDMVIGCQVLSLVAAPFLLDHPKVGEMFPGDAIERAKKLLKEFKGGIGAYSDSKGNLLVRQEVAQFIHERDGHPSSPEVIVCKNSVYTDVLT